ncbi:MAG: response regulator [Nitrospiraceae bacterium]
MLEDEELCSEICEAKTGEEALEAVRRRPRDLMIPDIALPDKHGLDVKEAKLLQPKLPVLMLSLYPEREFAWAAFKAGGVWVSD